MSGTAELDGLLARARSLAAGRRRAVLGITGSPGSGKSTLAAWLVATLRAQRPPDGPPHLVGPDADRRGGYSADEDGRAWVAHLPMDGFHLADVQLDRLGRRDRKGAPDTFDAAGYAALLRRVREQADDVLYAPGFERTLEQPVAASLAVEPRARLVVTEGNYLLLDEGPWARLAGLLDEVWFCDAEDARRLTQLVARHERFGKPPEAAYAWSTGPDELNAAVIRATRGRADLHVPDAALRSLGPGWT